MASTDRCNIPYPNEDQDPFYEIFKEMMDDIDNKFYAVLASVGNIVIPPPTVVFNASNGELIWDDDFIMPIIGNGYRLKIKFGPDNTNRIATLQDGDMLIITAPFTSGNKDINANFSVVNGKLDYASGSFVFGMRVGNKFYSKMPNVM